MNKNNRKNKNLRKKRKRRRRKRKRVKNLDKNLYLVIIKSSIFVNRMSFLAKCLESFLTVLLFLYVFLHSISGNTICFL